MTWMAPIESVARLARADTERSMPSRMAARQWFREVSRSGWIITTPFSASALWLPVRPSSSHACRRRLNTGHLPPGIPARLSTGVDIQAGSPARRPSPTPAPPATQPSSESWGCRAGGGRSRPAAAQARIHGVRRPLTSSPGAAATAGGALARRPLGSAPRCAETRMLRPCVGERSAVHRTVCHAPAFRRTAICEP